MPSPRLHLLEGHVAADLDRVDVRLLGRVGELQGGPTGLQDRDLGAVGAGERALHLQAQDVAVEREGSVVVRGLHDKAKLEHGSGSRSIGHAGILARRAAIQAHRPGGHGCVRRGRTPWRGRRERRT